MCYAPGTPDIRINDTMANIKKLSSKKVIFLGFAVVLSLLTALMVIWSQSISRNNERLQTITDQLIETQHVFAMRDAAYQRAIILHRMATMEDPFDRNDEYMIFKSLANNFITARDKFEDVDDASSRWIYSYIFYKNISIL